MSSNIKPKNLAKEAPNEPFKRAVTGCLRAIARRPELEVSFAAERPGIGAGKARLPEPPRKLTAGDAAIVRGHADAIALRMACHDDAIHRRLLPASQQGRAIFEAVEQARVEAIGARRMQGVAQNLDAMLEDRFQHSRYADVRERSDAPLEQAVALIVRERLTGLKPPKAAQKLVDLWRTHVEERTGRDLDRLASSIEDQRSFALAIRRMLAALDMEELGSDTGQESETQDASAEAGEDGENLQGQRDEGAEAAESQTTEATEAAGETTVDASEAMAGEFEADEEGEAAEGEQPAESRRPPAKGRPEPRAPDY